MRENMNVIPEKVKDELRASFDKWATTQTSLDNEDYTAVLDWLKWCIEKGEMLHTIGDVTLTQLVGIIWG